MRPRIWDKNSRIAITGVGPLAAVGSGKSNVLRSVLNQRTGLVRKKYQIADDILGEFYVHEIRGFDISTYGIDTQVLNEIRAWKGGDEIVDLYYFLATIKMAIDDSGLIIDRDNSGAVGLILAHENIGQDHFYMKVIDELSFVGKDCNIKPATKKVFFEKFYERFRRTGYELQSFMCLYHASKAFNVHGFSLIINNACASGLYAIEAASDVIRSGKCDRMIVAAVDRSSIFKQTWFNGINMCAKDGKIKPFAADRDGFTIGDGGAALVLERMESAIDRKANIYAEYIGGGFVLESWKVTYPDVCGEHYEAAMLGAIEAAEIKISDIDLVVPHGVGTNIIDRYEAKAICGVFNKRGKQPVVTALKPYIGHTLGSSALLETAIMLIALKDNKVLPTINCINVDKTLGVDILRNTMDANDISVAMKTACGFAGYNAACIFRLLA